MDRKVLRLSSLIRKVVYFFWLRFYPVAHRNNHIEIIVSHLFGLGFTLNYYMLRGMSEIPTYQIFVQLSLFKNIADMLRYGGSALAEQDAELISPWPP